MEKKADETLKATMKKNQELQAKNDTLMQVVGMLANRSNFSLGNYSIVNIGDNAQINQTVSSLIDNIIEAVESEPESTFEEQKTSKSKVLQVLQNIGKDVKEGAFKEAGKKILEAGINNMATWLPKVAPFVLKLVGLLK